ARPTHRGRAHADVADDERRERDADPDADGGAAREQTDGERRADQIVLAALGGLLHLDREPLGGAYRARGAGIAAGGIATVDVVAQRLDRRVVEELEELVRR